jgi:toxin secretion/phage lysis holin
MNAIITHILEAKSVKAFFSFLLMGASFLIGTFDIALQAMLVAMVLDFTLGLGYACFHGEFCKKKFLEGLKKEAIFAVVLILGHMSDLLIFHQEMEFGFQNFFVVYIGINEILSCLRHLSKMGFKIPKKIIVRLEGIRNDLSITK